MWKTEKNRPYLITGPCSAESEEQLNTIAEQLVQKGLVDTMRAGVWKPRTRPGSFEGLGEQALPWLNAISERLNLPVCIEVANASHVELALKHNISNFWIGARTTVNPFYVQEIADALKGTNASVLVKNPIHPDIELWTGAVERFQKISGKKVGAIHRGFSTFQTSKYRNIPRWEIPIELKRRFPELFIMCDVSHIAGSRNLITEVAQKSIDLGITGLMVETHPNPDAALSDAKQQVTAQGLEFIIKQLVLKYSSVGSKVFLDQLEELRAQIDKIDEDIVQAISSRLELTKEIGSYKKDNNVTVLQLERWNEILETRGVAGEKLNLRKEFIYKLYEAIHSESIRIQTEVVESDLAR
jgi:chorismate mutase